MINKAVYSHWSRGIPINKGAMNWLTVRHQLYSLVISVGYSSKWFKEIEIVTDSLSIEVIKSLELPFTSYSIELDNLDFNYDLWALGKIRAYQIQTQPFIHLDNDVILLKNLSDDFKTTNLLVQNLESDEWFINSYGKQYNTFLNYGKLTESYGKTLDASCLGIYGCNDLEFNKSYTSEVMELVTNNQELILSQIDKHTYCLLFEQYLFNAVAKRLKKDITNLVHPYDKSVFQELGYIHLMNGKRNIPVCNRLELRCKEEYPEQYKIINNLIKSK